MVYCLLCSEGDLNTLVQQIRAQLKKIAITDRSRVDEMFLRYDRDRSGFIDASNMRDMCRKLQLPVDDDVILAVSNSSYPHALYDMCGYTKGLVLRNC